MQLEEIARIQHSTTIASLVETLKLVNWHTALFLVITPIVSVYGLLTTEFVLNTWLLSLVCYYLGLLGMTTGYHRMYSHRTLHVARPVEMFLLFWATTDFSMSAIDWVKDHRYHHKYTDTDKDPYNIKKGFWWAHVGWLIWKRKMPKSDVSDLKRDSLLVFQHKWFFLLAFITGWFIPMLCCGLFWGDWRGGFFIAAVFKTVVIHHGVFSINSLAHYWGDTTFNDSITPRDSLICAIITLGEGYHNFHHEFPNDYRNGVHWTAFDPTKWFIAFLEVFHLASDLKRTSPDQIKLSKLQMIQRKIDQEKKSIFLGVPLEKLPFYSKEQIGEACEKNGALLVILDDIVFDVKEFIDVHPGGKQYLMNYIGKDISEAFASVYLHSNAAKNKLQTLRCSRLRNVHG